MDEASIACRLGTGLATGNTARGKHLSTHALRITEAALGENHPHVATTPSNMSAVYREQSKHQETQQEYRKELLHECCSLVPSIAAAGMSASVYLSVS